MMEARPDPDQLLATVKAEEARARRGKLRIFFGASAGVGKTYSMLEAARGVRAGGGDTVIGYVEPHGRVETERLLEGLEQLPTIAVNYRGTIRREFDLDAGLCVSGNRHFGRTFGSAGAARVCADTQCHTSGGGSAETARVASVAAAVDDD